MSEHDHEHDHEPLDASEAERERMLEHNLERLLTHAHEPPTMPNAARERVLERLRTSPRSESSTEPARRPPHSPSAKPTKPSSSAGAVGRPASARGPARGKATALVFTAIAALLVLLWVFGVGDALLRPDASEPSTIHANHDRAAQRVALTDGSVAWLRSGTELEQLGPRHLRLNAGEILVDVIEASEPLRIDTATGQALVLGTRLLLRSEAERTFAAVLRGQARLINERGELLLRAGQQAAMADAAPQPIAGKRLSAELAWARTAIAAADGPEPVRRGNLIARVPRWTGQTTASPEWPLPIREMTVDVYVERGQVRTTIDQTFFNPVPRQLEGVYQFPLPPDAAIARLAMYVDGQKMEAGVVGRDQGRDIYEQIVHRRRDPALLEWMQGNLFQIRVFPLPGRTEKRILLSYTQALDELYGKGELRVPIPAIDHPVGKLTYRIRVVGATQSGLTLDARSHEFSLREDGGDLLAEFQATNHAIGEDIVVDLQRALPAPAIEQFELRHPDGRRHIGVRLRPDLRELADASLLPPARDYVLLFDSSASRGPAELAGQRRLLGALLDQLDDRDRVAVLTFDSHVRRASEGLVPLAQLDRAALDEFLDREASRGLGASDLAAAIDAGVELLDNAPPVPDEPERAPTLVLLGDGLAHSSAGDPDTASLARRFAGKAQFVALSFGQTYDDPLLDALAAAGEGLHVHVPEGEREAAWRALDLLSTLSTVRLLDVQVRLLDVQGQTLASATGHASARMLAEGERIELLAELAASDPEPVAIELSGRASAGGPAGDERFSERYELPEPIEQVRWLPRAWARAHVAALTEQGVEQNAAEITKLGLEHFLVTPTTSLLVLESEAMYRDFDVRRPPQDGWAHYAAPDKIEIVREGPPIVEDGELVVRTPIAVLMTYEQSLAEGRIGLGSLGLIGSGRGGGGSGFGGRGFAVGLPKADYRADAQKKRKSLERRDFVTSNSQQWSWSTHTATRSPASGASARPMPMLDAASELSGFGSTIGANAELGNVAGLYHGGSVPWPQALHYNYDMRLDDLSELVPALFQDSYDVEREQLLLVLLDPQAGSSPRGTISAAARTRIDAARKAQANQRFRLPEGGELDIDGEGRFALVHERWGFLAERVIYDGERLSADHPELGLSVVRQVGPTSPALLGHWVPWMVPPAEHLERFYDVELVDERTLRLRPIAAQGSNDAAGSSKPSEPSVLLEVELDASDRLVALRVFEGDRKTSSTTFAWTDATLTITPELPAGEVRVVERLAGPARSINELAQPQTTVVNLPLHGPSELEAKLASEVAGSPAWIAIQQQRLATLVALARHGELIGVLDQLREHTGRVEPGELALAGVGVAHASDTAAIDRVLEAAQAQPLGQTLAAYLRAATKLRRGDAKPMATLAREQAGTPVGFMAAYRVLLRAAERRTNASAVAGLRQFLTDYQHPVFGYVATQRIAYQGWGKPALTSEAWLALAEQDGPWTQIALHQAGSAWYGYDEQKASELFLRSFDRARERGEIPWIDWRVQWSLRSTLGDAGWELAWTRVREQVAESGEPRQVIGFVQAASQMSRLDEVPRVLEHLDVEHIDLELGLVLHDALSAAAQMPEANALLGRLLTSHGDAPELLVRASYAAEQQGRLDEAAKTLERALDELLEDQGLPLDQLRFSYARLFDLRARSARPLLTGGAVDERAIAEALAIADRWRLDDPDNAEIDRLCAELLWSLDRDDEAWRHLSSVIDRHPEEGEALAWLATALERAGHMPRAAEVWTRAIAVEPTDPLHRLHLAQNLLARSHEAGEQANEREQQALAQLDAIIEGQWQERFSFVVVQAKQLRSLVAREDPG